MIGDTNCRFNALSPTLRCNVNPNGPCKDCVYFEAVDSIDSNKIDSKSKARNLDAARRELVSIFDDSETSIASIIIFFVFVLIFFSIATLVSYIDIPAKYFPDNCAEFILRHQFIPNLKSMIFAYVIILIPYFIFTVVRAFNELKVEMEPPGTSYITVAVLVLVNKIIYTLMEIF